ncbi:hypothetical protein K431DRAFT_315639 [Polychaeton citri CBS 116435]|uniref:Ribosomal RNA-processing protein 42 n=1 Tax=Polychaeton citri CBS 116435 TaxID=1314669 RepID=A0A9P4UM22_9PEZI|nr:hypothetical protein K431DRAFT_315639 [Polychaeton citri CBS 116435]
MAPYANLPLSPAELSYLYSSLAQDPPIRPDGRSATQFRPLIAESNILPSANGSARICFIDGTEAVVGVKAEVEQTHENHLVAQNDTRDGERTGRPDPSSAGSWFEISIEIPGLRDDDALPVFLAAMLTEALLGDGELTLKLRINNRFHWRLYIDVLLLSQPLSYPLPLLSLTTHLSLLSTRLPALISEGDEDPLFSDDWEASTFLYTQPNSNAAGKLHQSKPPITLLVISAGENIIFDPSRDELAVAEAVVAISIRQNLLGHMEVVALRTIDAPSRLTASGVPRSLDATTGTNASVSNADAQALREEDEGQSVWRPPRGGINRAKLSQMMATATMENGIGQEVMGGLAGVQGS